MAKKLEVKEEVIEAPVIVEPKGETELEHLHSLLQELTERNIRSIGDLENQIARLQK